MSKPPALPEKMQAVLRRRYGSPDVIEIADIDLTPPGDDEVLVRVRAASLNRADWYGMVGLPLIGRTATGMRRPKDVRMGIDYAGEVAAVGKNVTGFRPGDRVFGGRNGALAEYVAARHDRSITHMPPTAAFEEAAAVPVAAVTALQGLRDKGALRSGERVLVNGASGGVGLFAVQIAKALGAEVTAVCGPRGIEAARAGGADRVVDYTREDFTRLDERFDVLLDVSGTKPFRQCRRVLAKDGRIVIVGGSGHNRLIGPLGHMIAMKLGGWVRRRKTTFFISTLTKADMETLRDLLAAGELRPVIDRRFAMSEAAEAFRYMGDGHPQGKVVVTVA